MGKTIREKVKSWIWITHDIETETLLRENNIHFKKVDVIELEEFSEVEFGLLERMEIQ